MIRAMGVARLEVLLFHSCLKFEQNLGRLSTFRMYSALIPPLMTALRATKNCIHLNIPIE